MKSIFKKIFDRIVELLAGEKISDADLEKVFDEKAAGTGLQWRVSVVDFLKLLGINSSQANRDELAQELEVVGYESGSAAGNEALRVAVFRKLAETGGNVPASLLD